ncbi:MAG: flagellin, partial [Lachnospiraceae bacterium]|nr:flagellin [Lachnospiraceae bacterium]
MGTETLSMANVPKPLSVEQYMAKNEIPDPRTLAAIEIAVEDVKAMKAVAAKRAAGKGADMSGVQSVGNYGEIASGKAINKAADGASELAIGKKLEAEERGLNQGAENINEAKDSLKIADGALDQITDYLQRIRELSVKAMNGLNGDEEKEAIQTEISGLMEGIEEIAKDTQYNEKNLLDGSFATMEVASNPDGKGMSIKMDNATLSALGIDGYDVTKPDFDITKIDNALEKITSDRSDIGSQTNALEYAYKSNLNTAENVLASRSK